MFTFLDDYSTNISNYKRGGRKRGSKNKLKRIGAFEKIKEVRRGTSTAKEVSREARGWIRMAKEFGII